MSYISTTFSSQHAAVEVGGVFGKLSDTGSAIAGRFGMTEARKVIDDRQVQSMAEGQLVMVIGDVGESRGWISGEEELGSGWIDRFGFILQRFTVKQWLCGAVGQVHAVGDECGVVTLQMWTDLGWTGVERPEIITVGWYPLFVGFESGINAGCK